MMKHIANPCVFCLDEQRRPCCLECGHTFCTLCLVNYLQVRDDRRCPLCRRVFQVSAADLCEASSVSNTDPDSYVVSAVMQPGTTTATAPSTFPQSSISANLFDIDIDIDMLNDTLLLTLTEQEVRLFTDLYDEVLRDNQRPTSAQDAAHNACSFRNIIGI